MPFLQARLLCPPETRPGFAGVLTPFGHAPLREVLCRRGKTLMRNLSITPKSIYLGLLPLPGQIHAVQGCPVTLLRFSASPSPWDQTPPTQGYHAQLRHHSGKSCLPAWDCRTGLQYLVFPFQL